MAASTRMKSVMDAVGIVGIQQRIAQIESRFAMPVPVAPVAPAAAPSGVAGSQQGGFAAVLEAQMAKAPAGAGHAHTHTHAAAPAGRTRATPPAELTRYGNGRIPASALQQIGVGNHRLWAPAAQAFTRMQADARAAGVKIGVTDSYRSYEQQVDVARRKGLYSQGGLAAKPGTSNHGWGLSLDLDLDGRAQAWMRANARKHGFVEDVPREPWHWTFHTSSAR